MFNKIKKMSVILLIICLIVNMNIPIFAVNNSQENNEVVDTQQITTEDMDENEICIVNENCTFFHGHEGECNVVQESINVNEDDSIVKPVEEIIVNQQTENENKEEDSIQNDDITQPVIDNVITGIVAMDENVLIQQYEVGTLVSEITAQFPSELEMLIGEDIKIIPVTWSTDSIFLEATTDLYTFNDALYIYNAKLSEEYILEENVIIPTITVNTFSKKVEQPITSNVITPGWNYDNETKKLTIETQAGMDNWINSSSPNKSDATSVHFGKDVTSIEAKVFSFCNKLKTVTFEENSSLETIGEKAFYFTNITSIEIPSSVTSIGNNAFYGCGQLTNMTFEDNSNLVTIGEKAFYSTDITSIEIPSSVTSIGNNAFNSCSKLKTVTFEANSKLETIGESAFSYAGITSIEIPSSVTSIGNNAFNSCSKLKTVTFEANSKLETIGVYAFYYAVITSIEIPSSVTIIGMRAFSNCVFLETLIMPQNLQSTIDADAFKYTPQIKNIYITNDSGEIIMATQEHKDNYNAIKGKLGATDLRFGIETDPLIYNFGSVQYGADTATKTIKLKNTFTIDVNLAQPTSTNFIVSDFSKTKLAEDESATFTITPKARLGVGTYNEVINVKDENSVVAQIDVSVTIVKKPLESTMIASISDQIYTGNQIKPTISVTDGLPSIIEEIDYTVSYSNNKNVGTNTAIATITAADAGNYSGTVTKNFSIIKEDSIITTPQISEHDITYGESFDITFTPKVLKEQPMLSRLIREEPATKTAQLYYGNIVLATQNNVDVNTKVAFTVNTADKNIPATAFDGTEQTFTIKWGGDDNLNASTGTIKAVLNKKVLNATVNADTTKEYDGNNNFTDVSLTITNIVGEDILTAQANGTSVNANVGTPAFTATSATLDGKDKNYYILENSGVSGDVSITKKPLSDTMIGVIKDQKYTGNEIKPSIEVIDGKPSIINNTDYDVTYANNIDVGQATATITAKGNYSGNVTEDFTISKQNSEVTAPTIINTNITYGESFDITFTPKVLKEQPMLSRLIREEPATKTAQLYYGNIVLATQNNVDVNTKVAFTVNTADKNIPATAFDGTEQTFTIKWGGDDNLNASTGTIKAVLNKKVLNATVNADTTKEYDGNSDFTNVALTIKGSVTSDNIAAKATGTSANENVSTSKFIASNVTLSGTNTEYYTLALTDITGNVIITPYLNINDTTDKAVNVVKVDGDFTKPTFTGVNGEEPNGTVVYTYGGATKTYEQIVEELKLLQKNETVDIGYTFTGQGNYDSATKTGTITVTIIDIVFGDLEKALILKNNPTYGDTWGDILTYDQNKFTANVGSDTVAGTYTLTVNDAALNGTEIPKVGNQTYKVTFTSNDDKYFNVVVLEETVAVAQRGVAIAWDNTSLVYNSSLQAPTATIQNIVGTDSATLYVTGEQINVGTRYTATATLTSENSANYKLPTGNTSTFDIIAKPIVNATLTVGGTHTYTGSQIAPTDVVVKDDDKILTVGTDFTLSYGTNINAGTGSVTVTFKENYSGSATGEFIITKAEGTGSVTMENWGYGAIASQPVVSNPNKAEVTYNYTGTGYDSSKKPTQAGSYTVTASFKTTTNHTGHIKTDDFTIIKANATDAMKSVSGKVTMGGEEKVTIKLPTVDGITYEIPTTSGVITISNMSIKDNILTYSASSSDAGDKGIIQINVTSTDNYEPYTIIVTITSTEKLIQEIIFENVVETKTYGDNNFTKTVTKVAVDGDITYASEDASVATVDSITGEVKIIRHGEVNITATASETRTHAKSETRYSLNVAKANLTFTADDKNIVATGTLPEFTYKVDGLAFDDLVTTIPNMTTVADGKTKGIFDIVITDAIVDNVENYNITYVNSLLTITLDTIKISDEIIEANSVKNGIIINESAVGSVNLGVKYVNKTQMDALNEAILVAENMQSSANTIDEVEKAVKKLNEAITLFKNAIKVGKYVAPPVIDNIPIPTIKPTLKPTSKPTVKPETTSTPDVGDKDTESSEVEDKDKNESTAKPEMSALPDETVIDTNDSSMMLLPIFIIVILCGVGIIFVIIKKRKED